MDTSPPNETDPWDHVLLMMTALSLGLPLIFWETVVSWALRHQVLVPAAADPRLVMPSTDGAGLDERRLALLVLFGVVALATFVQARRVQRSRTRG